MWLNNLSKLIEKKVSENSPNICQTQGITRKYQRNSFRGKTICYKIPWKKSHLKTFLLCEYFMERSFWIQSSSSAKSKVWTLRFRRCHCIQNRIHLFSSIMLWRQIQEKGIYTQLEKEIPIIFVDTRTSSASRERFRQVRFLAKERSIQ